MNETNPHKDDFRVTEWHARDARRPGLTTYRCAPHLRGLTADQLRELAQADTQAQAERAAELRECVAEPQHQSPWQLEAEPEAGL